MLTPSSSWAKPDLSIIIVSYNTKEITKNCIDSIIKSLEKSKLLVELIVVDNGSKDGTIEILKKVTSYRLQAKIIQNKENTGFGKANNQGIKIANSDYILFLNSDILVLDDAIENMYTFYRQNESTINFFGGKLLNKDMTFQPSCGPFYNLKVVFGWIFLRGDLWNLTRNSPNKLTEVDWVSGACILTKKKYLTSLNYFDENIFMYMDEVDLLYRAKMRKYRVFFYPVARFIHLGSASSGERKFPVLQAYKGLLYFYKKHCSASSLYLLKIMLQLKAIISLLIGYILNNRYLKETYAKAYRLVAMA